MENSKDYSASWNIDKRHVKTRVQLQNLSPYRRLKNSPHSKPALHVSLAWRIYYRSIYPCWLRYPQKPCCDHYWRPRLCRVFLHSAKSPLHSAKTLLSVALGKVRSAKFFSAKGLCRVLFIGALGKIKNNFAECLGRHSAKYFWPFHRSRLFCRGPDPALGKKKLFFLKITLPSAQVQALGKVF